MERRRAIALTLAVLGVALVAFPIAIPAEDPPAHRVHMLSNDRAMTELPERVEEDEDTTVFHYANLSDRGQAIVDELMNGVGENGDVRATTPVGEGAPEFDYERGYRLTFVEYEGKYYQLYTGTRNPGPETQPIAIRFISFVVGTILGCTGGYLIVSNQG